MATSSTDLMFWPSRAWWKQNWRTRSIFCFSAASVANFAADCDEEKRNVVLSCSLYDATVSLDAAALPLRAFAVSGPEPVSCAIVSYHAPVMALANFAPEPSGLLSTSLRTTSRSRISPGILEESKSGLTPESCERISETRGFHVTAI